MRKVVYSLPHIVTIVSLYKPIVNGYTYFLLKKISCCCGELHVYIAALHSSTMGYIIKREGVEKVNKEWVVAVKTTPHSSE